MAAAAQIIALLPNEDLAAWQAVVAGFEAEYQPATATERFLVHELARAQWRIERTSRLEAGLLTRNVEPGSAEFANLSRYEQAARRAWHQALAQLLKLRSTAEKTEVRVSRVHRNQMEALVHRVMNAPPPELPETANYETKPIPVHLQKELDAHKRRDPLFDPRSDRSQMSKELQQFFAKQGL